MLFNVQKCKPNVHFIHNILQMKQVQVIPNRKQLIRDFLSHHQFPPYEEKSTSPADDHEHVSHVSETPPGSPSPDTKELAAAEKETRGTKTSN